MHVQHGFDLNNLSWSTCATTGSALDLPLIKAGPVPCQADMVGWLSGWFNCAGQLVAEFDAPLVAQIVHAMDKELTASLVADFGGSFTSDLVAAVSLCNVNKILQNIRFKQSRPIGAQ